ncbi:hypothetical protein [Tepidimonas alkaliphilus]|uniref:hypothetical protein n=1 Tax=Tepidimonas alkaliphilus TaxID=2588942 RepID=UPI00117C9AC0|nr:hypothetical protein [Tepidimonas alkaliphilus]
MRDDVVAFFLLASGVVAASDPPDSPPRLRDDRPPLVYQAGSTFYDVSPPSSLVRDGEAVIFRLLDEKRRPTGGWCYVYPHVGVVGSGRVERIVCE